MTQEFERRKNAIYPEADEPDREALRFVKSWHRHPALHEALWYHGVNLGEVDEYILLPEIIMALIERDQRQGGAAKRMDASIEQI